MPPRQASWQCKVKWSDTERWDDKERRKQDNGHRKQVAPKKEPHLPSRKDGQGPRSAKVTEEDKLKQFTGA